jgi:hypothetical protein
MKIVFLVEGLSMKYLLEGILLQIIPGGIEFKVVPHQGKQDLQKSIPIKLRSWNEPGVRFVIVHDKDSWDCRELKHELVRLCNWAGRPDTLVRIVCNELESWYFGDLEAVGQAFKMDILALSRKRKYRIPDNIENPKAEINKIVKGLQQISGAKAIAPYMDVQRNTSHSFKVFIEGVLRISEEMLA